MRRQRPEPVQMDLPPFHLPCGTPITTRDQPVGGGSKLVELVPYCATCQRDIPVEEMA